MISSSCMVYLISLGGQFHLQYEVNSHPQPLNYDFLGGAIIQ
ncbi:hypothetical protein OAE14_00125 [Alphaproteobacteria bacterium]|nr:hypothetical protein [Alphaproteobacteria bacterium]